MGISYIVSVLPAIDLRFIERASVNLSLPYNTAYNVSAVATSLCGQSTRIAFIQLYYGEPKLWLLCVYIITHYNCFDL